MRRRLTARDTRRRAGRAGGYYYYCYRIPIRKQNIHGHVVINVTAECRGPFGRDALLYAVVDLHRNRTPRHGRRPHVIDGFLHVDDARREYDNIYIIL